MSCDIHLFPLFLFCIYCIFALSLDEGYDRRPVEEEPAVVHQATNTEQQSPPHPSESPGGKAKKKKKKPKVGSEKETEQNTEVTEGKYSVKLHTIFISPGKNCIFLKPKNKIKNFQN